TGHTPGWVIVTVVALAAVVAYIVACALWPFAVCRRCEGNGKRISPTGKRFGNCRRCHGTGRRLRIGRRLWDYYRRLHSDAT
ncbi:MAG TPA: hypothetical protein VF049_00085, partial [Nocardioidaceae bacterium]